ncbi:MAG: hypothetical protein HC897_08470, partial [Thermoanaerobaculia bacterium]|nr:hypothetical protein [Thermoanaerobaculia bacterium]
GRGQRPAELFREHRRIERPRLRAPHRGAQPLDGLDIGADASPELADLDGDGDLDVAIGTLDGRVRFLANTGSSLTPAFFELTGALSAFDGVDVGDDGTPELIDLDGDGDLDAILGNLEGVVAFFENSGASTAPLFVEVTGPGKPFAGVDLGANSHPELIDLDGDDDFDAIFGEAGGGLAYFHNTGTPTGPFFLERTGAANPFDGVDVGRYTAPQLADLDGDGDLDALVGESGGRLVFFRSLASLVPTLPFADGFESGDTSAWSAAVP